MIRIFDTVADFRKKPESSGNAVSYGNMKESVSLFPIPCWEGIDKSDTLYVHCRLSVSKR